MDLESKPYTLYSVYTYSRAIPASTVSCNVFIQVKCPWGGPGTVLGVAKVPEKSSFFLPEPAVKVPAGGSPPKQPPYVNPLDIVAGHKERHGHTGAMVT